MKIICISGKARHGKDTLAKILKNHLASNGKSVLIAHFGDLVKYICKTFFNWNGEKDERGRALLQYVGTDVIRSQKPDFWTDFIKSVLKLFPAEWDYVLIPDCRFPNEIECFKNDNMDACLIRIDRSNFDSGLTEQQLNHLSETAMDHYVADYYVSNDSTIAALEPTAPKIIKAIGG